MYLQNQKIYINSILYKKIQNIHKKYKKAKKFIVGTPLNVRLDNISIFY